MKVHQIYFLQRADGLIKIGTTTDFETRLAALAVGVISILDIDISAELEALVAKIQKKKAAMK